MRAPRLACALGMAAAVGTVAIPALAQSTTTSFVLSPLEWVAILGGLALLPFAAIMVTSFAKVAVVLAILRSAIGAQGVPPAQVIIGLSLILTVFIMAPVGQAMVNEGTAALSDLGAAEEAGTDEEPGSRWQRVATVAEAALQPLQQFLLGQAHPQDRRLFSQLSQPLLANQDTAESSFWVLVPAFVLSELKEAFQIGFVIFIPFIVIDMVVANILLSLGMYMLSPTTISLPFKLLLFVMVDGWYLLVRGLVMSYQGGLQ